MNLKFLFLIDIIEIFVSNQRVQIKKGCCSSAMALMSIILNKRCLSFINENHYYTRFWAFNDKLLNFYDDTIS